MGQFIDLTGQKFARLTVLERDVSVGPASGGKKIRWHCRCDCGTEFTVIGKNLVNGNTKSCGCVGRAKLSKLWRTHGLSKTRTYRLWQSMRARCKYPSHATYRFYGGKGVKVCSRWEQFENFLADMGQPPEGMSLDRIDPTGDYSPENCRWADDETQPINLRKTVEWEGQKKCHTAAPMAARMTSRMIR